MALGLDEAISALSLLVFALVAALSLAALAAMAVQRRMVSPFGRAARTVRSLTDPLLKPLERRLLRAGGNPQSAPWWLIATSVFGGIIVVSGARWLAQQVSILATAAAMGGRPVFSLLVAWTFNLLILALIVRVIGSWFGASPYSRWMRPFVALTEWLLGPLRRILPPFGPFDMSPLVAWLLLVVVRSLVLNL